MTFEPNLNDVTVKGFHEELIYKVVTLDDSLIAKCGL